MIRSHFFTPSLLHSLTFPLIPCQTFLVQEKPLKELRQGPIETAAEE
jgi:hypothetical protein